MHCFPRVFQTDGSGKSPGFQLVHEDLFLPYSAADPAGSNLVCFPSQTVDFWSGRINKSDIRQQGRRTAHIGRKSVFSSLAATLSLVFWYNYSKSASLFKHKNHHSPLCGSRILQTAPPAVRPDDPAGQNISALHPDVFHNHPAFYKIP